MAIQSFVAGVGQCIFFGLSTDTKPAAGNCNGAGFQETDTGDTFLCNGTSWNATTSAVLQSILVSGTNIKTVNGSTLLGSGNLSVAATTSNIISSDTTLGADTSYIVHPRLKISSGFRLLVSSGASAMVI